MSNACGKRHQCSCGTHRLYAYAQDAFYCPNCDKWLEPVCGMEPGRRGLSIVGCVFCEGRKPNPSDHGLCPKPKAS